MKSRKPKKQTKFIVLLISTVSAMLLSIPSAHAVESINNAKIQSLQIYKSYRTVVQLDKTPVLPLSNNCTHTNKSLVGLVLTHKNEYNITRTVAVEELYSALLAARMTDKPVSVLTSGCVDFGGFTIPEIIRVIL